MSSNSQLLFTSSSQKAYDSWGYIKDGGQEDLNQEGIEDPNNYRNNLRNTITIPKNSEIAVVNVEFNRQAVFQASDSNLFYWYYGPLLNSADRSANDTGYLPYPIFFDTAGYDRDELEQLDSSALMRIFEQSLNSGVTHPDWWNRWTVSLNADGRRFQVTGDTGAPTDINLLIPNYVTGSTLVPSWIGLHEQNVLDKDWSAKWVASNNGNTITRAFADSSFTQPGYPLGEWDMESRVVCRTAPLSACGGHWIGTFNGAPNGFCLGLTRPQTHQMWANDFGENVIAYDNNQNEDGYWKFSDYEVKFWDEGNKGTRKLHVYQIVNYGDKDQDDNPLRQATKELIYWGSTKDGRPATQITEADMFASGKSYQHFKWKLDGNSLSFQIGNKVDFTGTNQMIFTAQVNTGADDTQLPYQVNQLNESLYPLVDIAHQNEVIVTVQFQTSPSIAGSRMNLDEYLKANTKTSYNYPLDSDDGMNTLAILGDDYEEDEDTGTVAYYPGSSFWGSVYSGAYENAGGNEDGDDNLFYKVGIEGVLELDIYHIDKNKHAGPTLLAQQFYQLDSNNESPDAVNGMITQASDDNDYADDDFDTPGEYKTHPDDPPNIQLLLGVERKNLIQSVDGVASSRGGVASAGARGKWVVDGTDDLGEEPDPLLIEVPSLNHQSYNMCRQCPSKFLYVCPRHDNNGDQFGKMFYEVTEKTYVALNNPHDINVTDLEIKFTDKNGITSRDLIGSSSVTFHIRKEKV